jgi:ADP-ribose pyrophosphatase YjhB (NUDIX family)
MDSTKTSKTSAGGVIFKKEGKQVKILLIKDNWNQWTFAKGFVEEDETYRVTAIRELTEELGIDAKKLKYVSDLGVIEYDYLWEKTNVHKKVYYYLYEWVLEQKFKLQKDEGIKKAKWVDVEWLKDEIGYKNDTMGLVEKIQQKFGIQV